MTDENKKFEEYIIRPPAFSEVDYSFDVFVTDEETEVEDDTASTSSTSNTSSTSKSSSSTDSSSTTSDTSTSTDSSSTDSTDSTNSKDSEEDEGFKLHIGDILETHSYRRGYSMEWDHDYADPTGTGKFTCEWVKKEMIYLYKGVRCLLKVWWKYPSEYQTLEDTRIKEKEAEIEKEKSEWKKLKKKIEKEKAKAKKEAEEAAKKAATEKTESTTNTDSNTSTSTTTNSNTSNTSTTSTSSSSTTKSTSTTSTEEEKHYGENPITPYDAELGFITDLQISEGGIEISISDYGKLLEQKKELSFSQTKRSEIMQNVIIESGFIPVVDFEDLEDDVIDWTNVTTTGTSDGGDASGDGSMTEQQAWDWAKKVAYNHGTSTHDPKEAFTKLDAGTGADCYSLTAALYYIFNFKVGIKARDICYHSPYANSGSHHTIQLYRNGQWDDCADKYRQYTSTNFHVISSRSGEHVCRESGGTKDSYPAYSSCPYSSNG